MPTLVTCKGICLKSTPYQEKARIATFYTNTLGKISVIIKNARGTHSKLAAASQVLSISTLQVRFGATGTAGLGTLLQYQPEASLTTLFTQEQTLLLAQTGAETLLKLSEGTTPDALLYFEALQHFLMQLATPTNTTQQQLGALLGFQIQCLQLQGLWADFEPISLSTQPPTRQTNIYFFSPQHHALFLEKPANDPQAIPISASTQQLLTAFSNSLQIGLAHSQTCSWQVLQKASRFLRFYLESFQGVKLYSYPLLEAYFSAKDS
jgi:DNA repair protein RecO